MHFEPGLWPTGFRLFEQVSPIKCMWLTNRCILGKALTFLAKRCALGFGSQWLFCQAWDYF